MTLALFGLGAIAPKPASFAPPRHHADASRSIPARQDAGADTARTLAPIPAKNLMYAIAPLLQLPLVCWLHDNREYNSVNVTGECGWHQTGPAGLGPTHCT